MAVNKRGRSGFFSVEDQPVRQRGPAYIKLAKLIPRRAKSQSRTADTLVGSMRSTYTYGFTSAH